MAVDMSKEAVTARLERMGELCQRALEERMKQAAAEAETSEIAVDHSMQIVVPFQEDDDRSGT